MYRIVEQIFPIIFLFFLGFFLRKINLFRKDDGDHFLKLVFFVTLPALAFQSFVTTTIKLSSLWLPICAVITMGMTLFISLIFVNKLPLKNRDKGVIVLGSSIMNTGFILPFIIKIYGNAGLMRANLFDFGNSFLIFTLMYGIAAFFGGNKGKNITKELLKMPPLWAMIFGLLFTLLKLPLPNVINESLSFIGSATMPLLIFALGLYFSPKKNRLELILLTVSIRFIVGLSVGLLLAKVIPLDPLSKTILVVSSAAPIGYNTLIFSKMENLDTELAASVVSIGIVLGLIITPICIYLF